MLDRALARWGRLHSFWRSVVFIAPQVPFFNIRGRPWPLTYSVIFVWSALYLFAEWRLGNGFWPPWLRRGRNGPVPPRADV